MKSFMLFICLGLIFSSCAKDENPIIPDPEPELARISGKMVITSNYRIVILDSMGSRKIPHLGPGDVLSTVWGPQGESVWYLNGTASLSQPYGWDTKTVNRVLEDGAQDTTLIIQSGYPGTHPSLSFTVSPDGEYIAVGKNARLYVYRIVNEYELLLEESIDLYGPVEECFWSPDSRKVIYEYHDPWTRDNHLIMYNVVTRDLKNLTTTFPFNCRDISWAPTSDMIAFRGVDYIGDDIYTVNISGAHLVNKTQTPDAEEYSPVFVPNTNQLAYVRHDSIYHVIRLDLNSGEKEEMVLPEEGSIQTPFVWSSNRNEFIFQRNFMFGMELRRFWLDSLLIETIYKGGFVSTIDWYDSP